MDSLSPSGTYSWLPYLFSLLLIDIFPISLLGLASCTMTANFLAKLVSDPSRDPLADAIAPPPSESYAERERRLEREREAKRVSDSIDEQIDKERKTEKPIKILLLGKMSYYVHHSILRLTNWRSERVWWVRLEGTQNSVDLEYQVNQQR